MKKVVILITLAALIGGCIKINLDRREIVTFNTSLSSMPPAAPAFKNVLYVKEDGGYLVGGQDAAGQMLLIELDEEALLQSTFPALGEGVVQAILPLEGESKWLIAGYSASDSYLIWLNELGAVERKESLAEPFNRAIGLVEEVRIHDMVGLEDGTYLACGALRQAIGQERMMLSSLSPEGEVLWFRTFEQRLAAYHIERTADGTIVLACTNAGNEYVIYALDAEGLFKWKRIVPNAYTDGAPAMTAGHDSTIVTLSSRRAGTDVNMVLMKYDVNGNIRSSYIFGQPTLREKGQAIAMARDSTYLLLGGIADPKDSLSYVAMRVHEDSTLLWQKEYRGDIDNTAFSCAQVSDQGFVMAGLDNRGADNHFFRLIKTDEEGAIREGN